MRGKTVLVSLRPEVHALLAEVSAATGTSMSGLAREALEAALPMFEVSAQAARLVKGLDSAGKKRLEEAFQAAGEKVADLSASNLEELLKGFEGLQEAAGAGTAGRASKPRSARPAGPKPRSRGGRRTQEAP